MEASKNKYPIQLKLHIMHNLRYAYYAEFANKMKFIKNKR